MVRVTTETGSLRIGPLEQVGDLWGYEGPEDILALPDTANSVYVTGFAVSPRAVDAALRLRYRVFNLELGEGLSSSAIEGLDRDAFDEQMAHLLVMERATGEIAGTYRLQTVDHALAHGGLYTAQEYSLDTQNPYVRLGVECGRACLAPEHRCMSALLLLWRGMAEFMRLHNKRYLFGCCSLTTTDPMDGWRAMKTIRNAGLLHPDFYAEARPAFSCGPQPDRVEHELRLPKLFRTYVRLGALVASGPALDGDFGTVDFLVMQDSYDITLSRLNTTMQ